jgi:hypothetical protein
MSTPLNIKITTPGGVIQFPSEQLSEASDDILKVKFGDFTFEVDNSIFPRSNSGIGNTMISIELASGLINNTNTVFTTSFVFVPETVEIYINGLRQRPSNYVLSGGNTITFTDAPRVGDIIEVQASSIDAAEVDAGNVVIGEFPTGAINGSNATFTTSSPFIPESMQVFVNGLRQHLALHYTLSSGTTIIFTESPQTGDVIEVDYIKS